MELNLILAKIGAIGPTDMISIWNSIINFKLIITIGGGPLNVSRPF